MIGPRDDRPWLVRHAVGALAAGLAASVLVMPLIGETISDAELYRVVLPAQTLVQIALIAWWASQSARRRVSLGLKADTSDLVGIPIGLGFQIAGSLLLLPIVHFFFEGDGPTQQAVESAAGLAGLDIVLLVIGAGILAPIVEELVFRGVLLRALVRTRGPRFATYMTASVFGLIHLLDPNAWLVVPILIALGILLAKVTISTGRLGRAIIIHMTFNLVAVAALFVDV